MYWIPLTNLVCPKRSASDCQIPTNSYNFVAPVHINVSVSDADKDSILTLARENYGRPAFDAPPFIDRQVSISSVGISTVFLNVTPGTNETLGWLPFSYIVTGRLSGCDNASLEGVGINVAAPYLMNNSMNVSTVAGTWFGSGKDVSGAGGLSIGRVEWLVVGLMVAFVIWL